MVRATLLRLLSSEFLRVFHITFHQMRGIENLLWPMDYTVCKIYSCIRVMKFS